MSDLVQAPDNNGTKMEDGRRARLKAAREYANFPSAMSAAKHFGWTESTYRSHENGARSFSITDARRYAHGFGVSAEWLFYNKGPMTTLGHVPVIERPVPPRAPARSGNAQLLSEPVPPSRRKLPVYGQAMAGSAGTLAFDGTTLAMVPCPTMLEDVTDAYAVYVHGDSMEPRYFAGETVYVNPARPPRQGDFVVAQIEDGNGVVGYVKKLKRRTATEVVLEQYNPPQELSFPIRDIHALHRVVGSLTE